MPTAEGFSDHVRVGRKGSAEISRIFAERVKKCRIELGLTQQELAERAGLSFKYVSYLESGRKSPGLDTALRIAEALDEELDHLCRADHQTGRAVPVELKQLLDRMRRLPRQERKRAVDILRAAFGDKTAR